MKLWKVAACPVADWALTEPDGQFYLEATQSERKRERARVARAVRPVKEYERPFARFVELKRGLPWTRVPAAIIRGHDLDGRTPFRKRARWTFGSAPPQSRLGRWSA